MDLIVRVFGAGWASGFVGPVCTGVMHALAKFQTSSTRRKVHLKKKAIAMN